MSGVPRPGSIRVRLTLVAAGVFAVTMFAAAALFLRALDRRLVADVGAADLDALEREALAIVGSGDIGGDISGVLADGRAYTIDVPYPNYVLTYDDVAGVVAAGTTSGSTSAGGDFLVTSLPVGDAILTTQSPLDDVRATLDETRRLLWVIGPVLVLIVGAVTWFLTGRALRPVQVMSRRVAEIESHSLHERVPEPRSSDEIAHLAGTMNQMLARLEAASDATRRLTADASHELRTPIAVMRTELEVARMHADNDWTATSDVVLAEIDRLQSLVDDLLLLARNDERRTLGPAGTVVALDEIVRSVAARSRRVPVAVTTSAGAATHPSGIGGSETGGTGTGESGTDRSGTDRSEASGSGAGPATVTGDADAVARAIGHLVDNAARSAATSVTVTIEPGPPGFVDVHVDDDGPGIPAADRDRVVQRFVRLDDARSRDEGGAGLGLAVADDVARRHGGSLSIGDAPHPPGARVSLTLPVGAG